MLPVFGLIELFEKPAASRQLSGQKYPAVSSFTSMAPYAPYNQAFQLIASSCII